MESFFGKLTSLATLLRCGFSGGLGVNCRQRPSSDLEASSDEGYFPDFTGEEHGYFSPFSAGVHLPRAIAFQSTRGSP